MRARTNAAGDFDRLMREVRGCTLCAAALAHAPRPVLQAVPESRVLIASQAPGRAVHASGVPFDDRSGERLRQWLGVERSSFYNPRDFAIVPMAFCFPGSGAGGDLPPRPECAPHWRERVLAALGAVQLMLVIGRHALAWHCPEIRGPLAPVVRASLADHGARVVLPHPSPRNNRWLARNPWFADEALPRLRARVAEALA